MGFLLPRHSGALCNHSIRHNRRSRHAGVGVHEAGVVRAALPARERRGRRAAGALLVHRLRRRARGAARWQRPHGRDAAPGRAGQRRGAAGRPARGARTGAAAAAGHSRRAARRRTGRLRVLRRGALLRASAATHARAEPHAGAALRGAALGAGVRPPDARHRAVACRLGSRAALAAPGSDPRAARCPAQRPARRALRAAARRVHAARTTWLACGARRSTSPPATSTSWCWRAASPASTSSIRSRRIARCG